MARYERSKKAVLVVVALVSTGCASMSASQRYVAFATKGQDAAQQAQDMADCEAVAKGHKQDEATAAMLGAAGKGLAVGVASTVGGAIAGAIFSGAGRGAQIGLIGLGVGAIVGAVEGVAAATARYENIYRACLQARGYTTGG